MWNILTFAMWFSAATLGLTTSQLAMIKVLGTDLSVWKNKSLKIKKNMNLIVESKNSTHLLYMKWNNKLSYFSTIACQKANYKNEIIW